MMRTILTPALAALALLAGAAALPTAAHAATCTYVGVNSVGELMRTGPSWMDVVQGFGRAKKDAKACDRARRECNRRLDRAMKRGKLHDVSTSRGARCTRQTTF